MPDGASMYLFDNLLNEYLLNPHYMPSTVVYAEVLLLSSPCHPVSLQVFWEREYFLHMRTCGAVGIAFLDPREQGPGCFCAEEDVRVCVFQYFDQRHTAVI